MITRKCRTCGEDAALVNIGLCPVSKQWFRMFECPNKHECLLTMKKNRDGDEEK